MKSIVIISGLIFFALGLWAETPGGNIFNYPLRSENMNAFTATRTLLAEHPHITGNFEQEKTLSRINRSLKSSGNFIIAKDMGMIWDTINPFPSTLTLGRDHIIQSRSGGQRTVISAQGKETFLRMAEVISAIFSGDAVSVLDNFRVFFYGNPQTWELGLIPLDNTIHSFAERIILKGGTAIQYIHIYEQNGDTVTYILSNHRYPAELGAHEKALFAIP
jgi:hypothetical protein